MTFSARGEKERRKEKFPGDKQSIDFLTERNETKDPPSSGKKHEPIENEGGLALDTTSERDRECERRRGPLHQVSRRNIDRGRRETGGVRTREGYENRVVPVSPDGDTSLWAGNGTKKPFTYLNENSTSEKTTMLKDADFMLDVLVPSIIIGVLLLGNGVILYIIFQFKKRKLSTEVQEEELRISQNGLDTATGRPSDV